MVPRKSSRRDDCRPLHDRSAFRGHSERGAAHHKNGLHTIALIKGLWCAKPVFYPHGDLGAALATPAREYVTSFEVAAYVGALLAAVAHAQPSGVTSGVKPRESNDN